MTSDRTSDSTGDSSTKIILVMGITGAGKSYLIREISGQDVGVGHGLQSFTQNIQQVICEISGHPVMILDTPGFDDTHRSDTEVLTEVADYLASLYENGFRVAGIIYLHNIREDRIRGSSYKNLQMFEKLCGQGALQNVVMLTNRWGLIDESEAIMKESELKKDYWNMYIKAGCKVDRYRDRRDLTRIFEGFLSYDTTVLEIQHEMVDQHMPLCETAAGEAVNIELARQQKEHRQKLAEIAADYDRQTQEMKAIMDEERLKLENGLQQLEVDKAMMMTEQRRAEEAAKAGMEEGLLKLAQEQQRMEEEFQTKMKEIGAEKNAVAQELAKLAAIREHQEQRMRMRNDDGGFFGFFKNMLGGTLGVLGGGAVTKLLSKLF
ncbi:hypothetical protein EMPS_10764 [Entomortierella parvispora]|uniref:G domain-containing protein n=1 Tax=Entomortierella parvispora TaxID=205924 RepID=A0A9P3HKH1_9FUNG|nr:hypothetical protein EMPS_10764 [Entomortierella parvispora]